MIGKLRHRITFQQNEFTRTKGVRSDNWIDAATVWARVEPLRGTEVTAASQKEGRNRHKVTLRYRPTVTEQFQYLDGTDFTFLDGELFLFIGTADEVESRLRIKFGSRFFDIRDVRQLYPHDELTVLEVEEAA